MGNATKWSSRDLLAVFYIIFCLFFAWCLRFTLEQFSLGHRPFFLGWLWGLPLLRTAGQHARFISLSNLIFSKHFPDRQYAMEHCQNDTGCCTSVRWFSQLRVSPLAPLGVSFAIILLCDVQVISKVDQGGTFTNSAFKMPSKQTIGMFLGRRLYSTKNHSSLPTAWLCSVFLLLATSTFHDHIDLHLISVSFWFVSWMHASCSLYTTWYNYLIPFFFPISAPSYSWGIRLTHFFCIFD